MYEYVETEEWVTKVIIYRSSSPSFMVHTILKMSNPM